MRTSTVLALVLLGLAHPALAQPAPAPPGPPSQPELVVVSEPLTIGVDPASATTFADLVRVELGKRGLRSGSSSTSAGVYFIDPEADTGIYVGGGLGFRVVSVDVPSSTFGADDSRGGVGLYGGAGVVFLRTADIRIILDARYDVNLFSLDNVDDGSHGVMISLGLSYTKWGRWL